MTRFTFQFITGLGLAMSATLNPAFSETLVNGGVIHFHGAIVSNPCEITARPQQLSMSCPENNRMQTRVLSYADALNGQSAYPDLASVSMKYINPEKSLAIVQVDYR
ncbi:TPA: type 1 fimbrial protein [Enterobacter asburiae]|uniref:type 1 fimbrial protein n=1 Tax=Escherichia coli TaxID=562 RepID=UPI0015DBDBA0|nr:hypothetical protein WP5S18E01_P20590 [Enterobacter cloacae]HDR2751977.1 type 1 fimbrial protein [Enterobacter asburiae]